LGIISEDFDVKDPLLVRHFAFVRYWRKNWTVLGVYISYL